MSKFDKQVAAFARKVQARIRVIGRESVQETMSLAQVTKYQGGRMPIVTGFLRASVQAAIGVVPRGPSTNPRKIDFQGVDQVAGAPIAGVLLRWDPNKSRPLYVGWTAHYARQREAADGFLQGATEKWDITVKKAVQKAKVIK